MILPALILLNGDTHGHAHTQSFYSFWILSGTTWVDLLEQEIVSGSGTVASAGPYANLHLTPDR